MSSPKTNVRRQVAKVKDLPDLSATSCPGTSDVSQDTLKRIRECLARATHPNTSEMEAHTAMRLATRTMERHNITQADLVAAEVAKEARDGPSNIAGQTTVTISSGRSDRKAILETWASKVVGSITYLCDCKAYSQNKGESISWVFYGIVVNAAEAAMIFGFVYNVIQDLSFKRKSGWKNSYRLGAAAGVHLTATDIKQQEMQRAKDQEAAAKAKTMEDEAKERQNEIERLAKSGNNIGLESYDSDCSNIDPNDEKIKTESEMPPTGVSGVAHEETNLSPHVKTEPDPHCWDADDSDHQEDILSDGFDDSDDDPLHSKPSTLEDEDMEWEPHYPEPTFKEEEEQNDGLDLTVDLDTDLQRQMLKREAPAPIKAEQDEEANDHQYTDQRTHDKASGLLAWSSPGALVLFRKNATTLAEEYLTGKNVKLSKGRKRNYNIADWRSYDDGKEDGKKIDLKRKGSTPTGGRKMQRLCE